MGDKAEEWAAQLMALRALTATTGVIHEAQKLNLQQWGALAFGHVGKWEARVDVASKTVTYKFKRRGRRPQDLAHLVAGLVRSVHWLLGLDWGVRVQENGKLIFEGERVSKNTNEERKRKARAGAREGEGTPE